MKASQTLLLFCIVVSLFTFLFSYFQFLNELWKRTTHFKQERNVMSTSESLGKRFTLLDEEEAWQTEKSSKTFGDQNALEIPGFKHRGISFNKNDNKLPNGKKGEKEEKRQLEQPLPVRKNLFILSPGRAGSSFLGSLFDNNPQVMYCYEPLYGISEKFNVDLLPNTVIKLLDSFFRCDFSNVNNLAFTLFEWHRWHRDHSKALSDNALPSFTKIHLSNACHSYTYSVIKVLSHRVPYKTIRSLKTLFQEDLYDVKLVHLVRDPRAIVYSRIRVKWMKNHSHPDFNRYVHGLCDPLLQDLRIGLLYPPPWLKNRFKVVRYEDLALNTLNVTQELYRFAGFEWSASIDQWIDALARNTEQGNEYSLKRNNVSAVINGWRDAPEPMIRAVENNCGDLMKFLGYEKSGIYRKDKTNTVIQDSAHFQK